MLICSSISPAAAPTATGSTVTSRVAPVDQPQGLHQRGLRLAGDHARAEPAERRDAVADMRADVEHEIAAACTKPRIEPVHGVAIVPPAVIDAQRAKDAAQRAERVEHVRRAAPPPRWRAARACAAARAARFPPAARRGRARISARPTDGHEVMTASGIDSAGPPAMNSAYGMAAGTVKARIEDAAPAEQRMRPELPRRIATTAPNGRRAPVRPSRSCGRAPGR